MRRRIILIVITLVLSLHVLAWGASQTFQGNITGNAATVTTNANLTGDVTSTGNATTIKEAPAIKAPTLSAGSELVTNGTFPTDTTGWTAVNNAVLSAAGGYLTITTGASDNPTARQTITTVSGKYYKFSVSHKNGTLGSGRISVGTAVYPNAGWNAYYDSGAVNNADWTTYGSILAVTGTSTVINLINTDSAGGGKTDLYDTVTMNEVPLTIGGDAYSSGNIRIVIPTYPNNAAAIAGGLVPGQFYRVNAATDPEPLYIVH